METPKLEKSVKCYTLWINRMIPKTIHYCWFGPHPKNEKILRSMESWKKVCPEFTIVEWNESNFPVDAHPFTSRMQKEKRFAFVSDYARLQILEEHGGFYLDTDMLLLQSLSPLTGYACVLGEEEPGIISAGMIGAVKGNEFIKKCREYYDIHTEELITIPRVLSKVYTDFSDKSSLKVFPPKTFYPFDAEHIDEWRGQDLGSDVHGVHLWNYSWGNPLNKLFKKLGIHALGVRITEALGIKTVLKKIFKII